MMEASRADHRAAWAAILSALVALAACREPDDLPGQPDRPDTDGDGVPDDVDCAPDNATVFLGGGEYCNGLDDNCDGVVPIWETEDQDQDGFGVCAGDCDDRNPAIPLHGHPDICDHVDSDCDGLLDEDGDFDTSHARALRGRVGSGEAWTRFSMNGEMVNWNRLDRGFYGWHVSGLGDVNGDGWPDVAVQGADSDEDGPGPVGSFVFFGPFCRGSYDVSTADSRDGIAPLGDVDGNGADDFATRSGILFSGVSEARFLDVFGAWGERATAVSVGDLNFDGRLDVGVIVPPPRRLDILLEVNSWPLTNDQFAATIFGSSLLVGPIRRVIPVGDVDADGANELAFGLPQDGSCGVRDGGSVRIVTAPTSGSTSIADAVSTWCGPVVEGGLGWDLAQIADATGDGVEDYVVGAPQRLENGDGHLYLVPGPPPPGQHWITDIAVTLPGIAELGVGSVVSPGFSIQSLADLDGDGLRDVAIGAPDGTGVPPVGRFPRGAVLLWRSTTPFPTSLSAWTDRIEGPASGPLLGHSIGLSVADAGDVDRDGLSDVLVGEWLGGAALYVSGGRVWSPTLESD